MRNGKHKRQTARSAEMTRRQWMSVSAALATTGTLSLGRTTAGAQAAHVPTHEQTFGLLSAGKKIPVIFDSDIGGDIDDTWALVYLMKCPELDVKLLVTDAGNTVYRARIMAKMMDVFGRSDMPIGIGIRRGNEAGNQSEWIADYPLSQYKGPIHQDGVKAMVDTIHASPDPVTVIAIGGVPTVAAALRRDPTIVNNARFVGMHGSIRRGYGENSKPVAEANVRTDPEALAQVFAAPWECSITPLDTCDQVVLTGADYQKVYQCKRPEVRALMENYKIWSPSWISNSLDRTRRSSTLFDLVAVYMAYSEKLLRMETLPIRVTDKGMTVVDDTRKPVRCALGWTDLAAFEQEIVARITA
jgi:inosine-uridine nucleoside N-ribohydrolase